jgi:hypothetical protein
MSMVKGKSGDRRGRTAARFRAFGFLRRCFIEFFRQAPLR